MSNRESVQVFLTDAALIPMWALKSRHAALGSEKVEGRRWHYLEVCGGDAGLMPGGAAFIKIPNARGSGTRVVDLGPLTVYFIRDLKRGIVRKNHLLCPRCHELTGERKNAVPAGSGAGLKKYKMECRRRRCTAKWEVVG